MIDLPTAARRSRVTVRGVLCRTLLVLFAVTAPTLAADKTAIQRFELGDRRFLELQVPSSWSAVVRRRQDHSILEIAFVPLRGVPFEVSLTPVWAPKSTDPIARERELRELVAGYIDSVKTHSSESELRTVKLEGASGMGLYFSATDKSPRPSDYKYLTQGVTQLDDLRISFKILTHDGQAQVVGDAISMLKNVRLRAKS